MDVEDPALAQGPLVEPCPRGKYYVWAKLGIGIYSTSICYSVR